MAIKLTIDFVGKVDGEAFEGGTPEGIELVLGQGGFIPGFEEGLVGAKAGEDRTVEVTFPDALSGRSICKGKTAAVRRQGQRGREAESAGYRR